MAGLSRWQSLLQRFPLVWIASGSALAVLLDQCLIEWFAVPIITRFLGYAAVIVGALLLQIKRQKYLPDTLRWVSIVLVMASLAAVYHGARDHFYRRASISVFLSETPQPTILRGYLSSPVTIRGNPMAGLKGRNAMGRRDVSPWQSQLEIDIEAIRVGKDFRTVDGSVLVFVDDDRSHFRPGDFVEIYGSLQKFQSPTNPGEIDLTWFYRRRGLHGRVDVSSESGVVRVRKSDGWFYPAIAAIAESGRESLLKHTSPSSGSLAVALVIGQREFVDHETRDALLATGTAHLLSVSGLHLAIIVFLATWIATIGQFSFPVKSIWLLGVCVLYVAITGGRPPVMRAAVLVAAVLFALWVRKPSQPLNSLAGAAIVLMIVNPENVFAVGVHLSFLAVITLMLCGRRREKGSRAVEQSLQIEERFNVLADQTRGPLWRYGKWACSWIWQLAWFSGCVSLISLPLVWHQFHLVSWVSIATNVLLTPGLLVALPSGVLTVTFGAFSETAAIVPGFICDWSLRYMRLVIETAASLPRGHAWLPSPPTWLVFVFYGAMAATIGFRGRKSFWYRLTGTAIWFVVAWWIATTPAVKPENSVEATFIDIGHGTSVVLRMPDDSVWLYDCGHLGNETNSCRDIDTALWSMGVTRIDGVILSHADADHYNALPGLLRRFSVNQIVTPKGMLDQNEPGLIPIRQSIARHSVGVREVQSGDTIGGVMKVLHPTDHRIDGSDNANSLVLRIDCGGNTLLLPGDLEAPGTQMLIDQRRPPPGGALMAPHHGSLSMDASGVLQWCRPTHVIVSGGKRAKKPAVTEMLNKTGSDVHITAQSGACRVTITQDGNIEVRRWLDDPW